MCNQCKISEGCSLGLITLLSSLHLPRDTQKLQSYFHVLLHSVRSCSCTSGSSTTEYVNIYTLFPSLLFYLPSFIHFHPYIPYILHNLHLRFHSTSIYSLYLRFPYIFYFLHLLFPSTFPSFILSYFYLPAYCCHFIHDNDDAKDDVMYTRGDIHATTFYY